MTLGRLNPQLFLFSHLMYAPFRRRSSAYVPDCAVAGKLCRVVQYLHMRTVAVRLSAESRSSRSCKIDCCLERKLGV